MSFFITFAFVRVTQTSKAMQTAAIRTGCQVITPKYDNSPNHLNFREVYFLYRFTKKTQDL